jgi:precorrin-2 dehydrogenase / sirohydrochlorin ferrochelatase
MGFIPIFLQIEGQPCLVVGGGEVAQRKVGTLVAAGAAATVICPKFTDALVRQAQAGQISLLRRAYREGDMAGFRLVYAATNDHELHRRLFEEARRLNILINVSDSPEFCSFIVPSIVRRGRLQVAISTEGASPATARLLRERMERWLGDELEVSLEVMAAARDWLKRHEPDGEARARILKTLAASDAARALCDGNLAEAQRIVTQCLGREVKLEELFEGRALPEKANLARKPEC